MVRQRLTVIPFSATLLFGSFRPDCTYNKQQILDIARSSYLTTDVAVDSTRLLNETQNVGLIAGLIWTSDQFRKQTSTRGVDFLPGELSGRTALRLYL